MGEPTKDADDAYAATVAPTSETPTPPIKLAVGSHQSEVGTDVTIAAPAAGELPPLPEVASALYQTDKEIARGGMGRIVAAEDRRLGRRVALKELIDPAGDQLHRFQREALITARLQHPGIVPVYEAGRWPTGEPFFAMKLVSGKPLDKVISEAARLEQRLELLPRLAAACDAMAYAHSQRVIHRDLKPGNVLLGDFGETVVIDWGLAKNLDDADSPASANRAPRARESKPTLPTSTASSTLTVAGAVMGTPAYMPPEQARGELVDQRADVFALGAMIYHVLAGVPPYNARTATDVIEAAALGKVVPLREREPRAPKDLVAIVERAMAQIPAERYPHAAVLAEELRRFLTGKLVDAHRYTALQRIARFVRRHRAAVTIGAIATVTIAVGGTMAVTRVVHARDVAEQESRLANTRKVAAERLIDYMFTHVKTQLGTIGRLDMLAGLGNEVRRYYDTLSKVPGGMPAGEQLRMAEAIELIGQAEQKSGKVDLALETFTKERDKLVRVAGDDLGVRTKYLRRMIAQLDVAIGSIQQQRGKLDAATAAYVSAKKAWDQLREEDPTAREVLLGDAETHDRLGDLLRTEGKNDQAFEEYTEAKTHRELAASKGNGKVSEEVVALSTSHLKLASVYQNRGDSRTALEEYRTALRLRESVLSSQPDNPELEKLVLDVYSQLGDLQRKMGDDSAAIDTYRKALPRSEALVTRDPANTEWQRLRGMLLTDLGYTLLDRGAFKDGNDTLLAAEDLQKDLVARDPKSTTFQIDLSRSYTRGGDGWIYLGRIDEGIAQYQLSLDIRKHLVGKEQQSVPFRRSLAWSYFKLGTAYAMQGDGAHALEAHEQALALRDALVAQAQTQGDFENELASSEYATGSLLLGKDQARATSLIAKGAARVRALVEADTGNAEYKDTFVHALVAEAMAAKAAGDAKRRESALTEALAVAEGAAKQAPENAHWPGAVAEIEIAIAELALEHHDARAAAAAFKVVREQLEPLAKAERLPASRKPLLERAKLGS